MLKICDSASQNIMHALIKREREGVRVFSHSRIKNEFLEYKIKSIVINNPPAHLSTNTAIKNFVTKDKVVVLGSRTIQCRHLFKEKIYWESPLSSYQTIEKFFISSNHLVTVIKEKKDQNKFFHILTINHLKSGQMIETIKKEKLSSHIKLHDDKIYAVLTSGLIKIWNLQGKCIDSIQSQWPSHSIQYFIVLNSQLILFFENHLDIYSFHTNSFSTLNLKSIFYKKIVQVNARNERVICNFERFITRGTVACILEPRTFTITTLEKYPIQNYPYLGLAFDSITSSTLDSKKHYAFIGYELGKVFVYDLINKKQFLLQECYARIHKLTVKDNILIIQSYSQFLNKTMLSFWDISKKKILKKITNIPFFILKVQLTTHKICAFYISSSNPYSLSYLSWDFAF